MVICNHCKKEYPNHHEFEKDCFTAADGWTWEYFHNCLKNKDVLDLMGFKK